MPAAHLERLDDPDGAFDAVAAAQAGGWTALPGNLSAGFTSSTVWLRLPVQVETIPQGGWMLRLSNSLLDDVRVYVSQGAGWTLLGRSGEDLPRRDWPVDYRSPVIQFDPPQPGSYVILVRLQSKNALATRLEVWQRLAFDNQSRREGPAVWLVLRVLPAADLRACRLLAGHARTDERPVPGLYRQLRLQ